MFRGGPGGGGRPRRLRLGRGRPGRFGECERVEKWAEAEGLRSTVPLSPGLVGWPVASGQRQIFALLDGSTAGVSLNAACMMSPEKSTSMVIGLGVEVDDAGESCDFCALAGTCRFRHGAASAHG